MKKVTLALWGSVGAIAPDVLILYSKRFSMASLDFSLYQYVVATTIYIALAGLVASVFPYGEKKTEWKAFGIGFSLPVVLSGLLALQRDQVIVPKGVGTIPGTLLDLMSLI